MDCIAIAAIENLTVDYPEVLLQHPVLTKYMGIVINHPSIKRSLMKRQSSNSSVFSTNNPFRIPWIICHIACYTLIILVHGVEVLLLEHQLHLSCPERVDWKTTFPCCADF